MGIQQLEDRITQILNVNLGQKGQAKYKTNVQYGLNVQWQ